MTGACHCGFYVALSFIPSYSYSQMRAVLEHPRWLHPFPSFFPSPFLQTFYISFRSQQERHFLQEDSHPFLTLGMGPLSDTLSLSFSILIPLVAPSLLSVFSIDYRGHLHDHFNSSLCLHYHTQHPIYNPCPVNSSRNEQMKDHLEAIFSCSEVVMSLDSQIYSLFF